MKRTILKIAAPLIAVLTLMIGLRVGAGEAVRAAVVFGAPPGHPAPEGKTRLAWQLLTFLDDRGVKETIPIRGLEVIAHALGHEARWTGESNADGIAEIALEMEGVAYGDPIDLEVRAEGEKEPLASGTVRWGDAKKEDRRPEDMTAGVARPTVRSGPVGLDVVIEGERLIAGFPTTLWVRVTPPMGIAKTGIVIATEPEPGLLAERERATTCGAGWAAFPMTAQAHVTGATFVVRGAGANAGADAGAGAGANADAGAGADAEARVDARVGGKWFGALPVAAGAFFISAPRWVKEAEASRVVLIAPNPRDVVYVELDDTRGRVAAAALPVVTEPGDPTPRAHFELPPLAPGLHWLVVSGEPRGAERMAGAAVSKTFVVGDGAALGVDVNDACSLGPYVAQRPATGFARWVALDGLPSRSASNVFRHRLGLFIGLFALLAAAVLETLLLVAASRETRISLQLAELDEDDPMANKLTAKTPGGGVVVAILIVMLGLALLAVLLIAKG